VSNKEEVSDEVKKEIERALNNEYKEILKFENKMKTEIFRNILSHQTIASVFPTTFYISTNYEISSKGYLSFLDFYSFTQRIKAGFIDYYVKNKFYKEIDKVVPFISGDEHFFPGKSRIHGRFWLGVLMTVLYIVFALILAYIGFKKFLSCEWALKKNTPATSGLEIELKQGAYTVITIPDKRIFYHFFNVFFGNIKYFFGKIKIDGTDMVRPEKESFLYLCEVEHMPGDMTVRNFLDFINQWENVNKEEMNAVQQEFSRQGILEKLINNLHHDDKIKVLLSACRLIKRQVYMLYNFAHNMSEKMLSYFQEEVDHLKENGSSIIYFRHKSMFTPYHVDRWLNIVKRDDKYKSELVTFDKS
jgi:ABC-type transport system involved in cytochrome c biogenesis ATPase subunit